MGIQTSLAVSNEVEGKQALMPTETDTCRTYVVPKLYDAGWREEQIAEQRTFTDGHILVEGRLAWRGRPMHAERL